MHRIITTSMIALALLTAGCDFRIRFESSQTEEEDVMLETFLSTLRQHVIENIDTDTIVYACARRIDGKAIDVRKYITRREKKGDAGKFISHCEDGRSIVHVIREENKP